MSIPDLHFIGYLLGGSWNMAEVSNYFKKKKGHENCLQVIVRQFLWPFSFGLLSMAAYRH